MMEQETAEVAAMLRAIGHPVRLEIIRMLSETSDEVSVIRLMLRTRQPQSSISGHLKALKRAGIIVQPHPRLRSGYVIRADALANIKRAVREL